MKCAFCEKEVESVHEAVELGWYPDFWVGERHYQGPICPECQREHLVIDADGEYVLKPDHSLPRRAVRLGLFAVRKEIVMSQLVVKPKFPLGRILATPGALKALEESGQNPVFFLEKHVQGDWGTLGDEDKQANDQALVDGSRILSAYMTLKGERIWIITEAADDEGRRTATTLLRPDEY
jgi:hypothetical protein